jgi:hypothetical protein
VKYRLMPETFSAEDTLHLLNLIRAEIHTSRDSH